MYRKLVYQLSECGSHQSAKHPGDAGCVPHVRGRKNLVSLGLTFHGAGPRKEQIPFAHIFALTVSCMQMAPAGSQEGGEGGRQCTS